MKRKLAAFLAGCILCLALTGCANKDPSPVLSEEEPTMPTITMTADPQGAIDQIYQDITIQEIEPADDTMMEEQLGFELEKIETYYVRYSSGRYGLSDVYMIRPTEDGYDAVREQLETIKFDRIKSTESFDVLDANKIARNAQIFQYGRYLIMLMLPDNEAAIKIIDAYLPSTEVIPDTEPSR